MIGAPVPGVVNALQVTIPGRSPSVPSALTLGNARDEKKSPCYPKTLKCPLQPLLNPSTLISSGGDRSLVPLDFLSRAARLSTPGYR